MNLPAHALVSAPVVGAGGGARPRREAAGIGSAWRRLAVAGTALAGLIAQSSLPAAESVPAKSRTIQVAMDNAYPPYVMVGQGGKLQGILIDQWELWEKKTGLKVEIHAMDWGEALSGMRAGRFDVIDTIFTSEERQKIFDFTPPYARIEVPIFFRKDISGINDLESLAGFPVAVKTGDHAIDVLRAAGVTTLLEFNNYEAIVMAAKAHRINVFVVDAPPALYFLNKLGIEDEFRRSAPIDVGQFHRAVRKGDAERLRLVELGFAAIGADELKRIDEKWEGQSLGDARYVAYAGYAAAAVLMLFAGLVGWNRALSRIVAHRTAALSESEARFRQVVENIQEVFWMSDVKKNRMVYISPSYEKIWGRTCASLYTNPRSWLESIHPDDRERVLQAATTKQIAGTYDETYRVLRPDGAMRWVRDQAFPVKDAAGDVTGIVGVAEDITGRKKLEEQFLRAQRMEAIGTLSSGIAHDLNNILAPMMLSSALLRDAVQDPRDRELLVMLERSAKRGAEMIRQLLIFSRGAEGQRAQVKMPALLQEMAAIVRETFPRDLTLLTEAPAELPAVLADATQLHQVLLNLCVNARDAMPGGGTLTLNAQARLLDDAAVRPHGVKPGLFVVISVEDTGVGIPPHTLDRIFEPFFSTKEVGRGSGLGLSTVLGIVKSHGGFVTVSSELGRGSAFRVHLPAAGAGAAEEAVPPSEQLPPRGTGEMILVVDDELDVRQATQQVLERHGYRTLIASNGRDAIACFVEHQREVQLVLTDVMMPVMNGVELAQALRAIQPDLRLIAASGMVSEARQAEFAALGVTEFLAKPYESWALLQAVHHALARGASAKREG